MVHQVECEGQGEDFACPVGKVDRITTAGAISEFVVPTTFSFPTGIAAGPDGAMWFTEMERGKIGRIAAPLAPKVSLKVAPRRSCTSSVVKARVKVTGGAKLVRATLSLDGRRIVSTTRRRFRVREGVRGLARGSHTLKAAAVDKARNRSTTSQTFRRC